MGQIQSKLIYIFVTYGLASKLQVYNLVFNKFAQAEYQKVNKHPKFSANFDIRRLLEHLEYDMNRTLANVLWLQLNGSPFDKNSMFAKVGNDLAGLKEIGPKMTNLEILSIVKPGTSFAVDPNEFQLTLEWISSFKNLKELEVQAADLGDFCFENLKTMTKLKKICLISCFHGTIGQKKVGENILKFFMEFPVDKTLIIENGTLSCDTSDLVQILKALGAIKNLEIRSNTEFEVLIGQDENDWDYEMTDYEKTADVFEKALEIISQEFPQGSTDFEIKENMFDFRISKSKGNAPELIQGSESETSMDYSDDEDDQVDNDMEIV